MDNIELKKSNRKNKKLQVKLPNNKIIHFGDSRYEDYTTHKDDKRKKLYEIRHSKNEDWNNTLTAGFWSKWILWNKPNINDAIKDTEKKFNINIKFIK